MLEWLLLLSEPRVALIMGGICGVSFYLYGVRTKRTKLCSEYLFESCVFGCLMGA